MKKILWIFPLTLMIAGKVFADKEYLSTVAQVRVTNYSYSIDHPWQKGSAGKSFGSAVFIDGDRLLTNAHVVDSALRVELRRVGSDTWYRASVEHVSEAPDLAMLKVSDEEFFVDAKPAALSSEIKFGSEVLVVGFPEGGDTVSVTKGVLSRTEETDYAYSMMTQIAYQIDAAINNGNSGGAVFSDGRLMGISFQASDEAENIGYAIPVTVIEQFLTDIGDGVVDGVPQLPFFYLPIRNVNMQKYLGLSERTGVYVSETVGDPVFQCVQNGDVVTSIEGLNISASGKVESPEDGVVSVDHVASSSQIGDILELEVRSGGKGRTVNCELKYNWNNIWGAPGIDSQYRPKWLEVGGLILVDMAEEVFLYLDENEIEVHEKASGFRFGMQQGTVENPVGGIFVANVLDHDANVGYELTNSLLKSVNGEIAGNVDAVKKIISENSSPWLVLEFYEGSLAVFKQSQLELIKKDLSMEYGF
jgi:S1-C subfamily serine protease